MKLLAPCVVLAFLLCTYLCAYADDYENLKLRGSNELIDMAEDNMRSDTLWQNSIVALNIVVSRYSEKSDKTTRRDAIVAMRHLGNLYLNYDVDYYKAYKYLHTACQIAEEDNDTYDLAFIYNNLANVYHWGTTSEKERAKWVGYLAKAADAAAESKNQEAMMAIALNIINVSSEDSLLWDKYRDRIDRISQFSFTGKYTSEGKLTRALIRGWKLFMAGDAAGAVTEFNEARKISTDSKMDITYGYSIDILLIEILHSIGEYDKCLSLLKSLAVMSRKTDNKDYELSAYRRIASTYREMNSADSAAEYEKKYNALKSIFEKRAGFRDVRVHNFLSEIEKREEPEIENADADAHGQYRRYLLLAILAVILPAMVFFIIKLRRGKPSRHKETPSGSYHQKEGFDYQKEDVDNQKEECVPQCPDDGWDNGDGHSAGTGENPEPDCVLADENDWKETASPEDYRDIPSGACNEEAEEELSAVYSRVIEVMTFNKEVYQSGFSLSELAKLLKLPRNVVSKAINNCHGTNFHQLLNDYRIKKVLELIDSGQASNYTIETLAQSVGFKSRPSFVTLFKKKVGVSPSEYIRRIGNP